MWRVFIAGVEPVFPHTKITHQSGYRYWIIHSICFHKPPKGLSLTAKHSMNQYALNKDFDASDGNRTRVSCFHTIYLPGTPYIPNILHTLNTRLGASPLKWNFQKLFTHNPVKASQEGTICLEKPSLTQEAYQETEVSQFHVINQLGCYRWNTW